MILSNIYWKSRQLKHQLFFARYFVARLSQTDARASAVFVDEFDAGGFQGSTNSELIGCS
jgi:hypothetical protein